MLAAANGGVWALPGREVSLLGGPADQWDTDLCMRQTLRVAWYRSRTTFARQWGGYLAIALLIGLVGGVAMAALAGARRTQSAYPAFLRSTNPSDLTFPTAVYGLTSPTSGYDPVILKKIAALPHVASVATSGTVNNALLRADGKEFTPPKSAPANFELGTIGSISGLYINQDRIAITAGRMVDPSRQDEMLVSAPVAKLLGIHPGAVLNMAFYTNAQEAAPGPSGDQYRPHPHIRLAVKVVGIGEYNNAVIQDDVDAVGSNFTLFTPALSRRLAACCTQTTTAGLRLVHGSRDVPAVAGELAKLNPLLASHIYVSSVDQAKVERAIKPASIALGAFGLIATLAALLLASQVIGRQLRTGDDDLDVLRALGARPMMTSTDGLIGVVGAIVLGSVLAMAIAAALSPLSPIGAVRSVYPDRGIAFDWTVIGLGAVALVIVLSAVAIGIAYRQAPHRVARRSRRKVARSSRVARAVAGSALSAPAATGVRYALEPGRGRSSVPVRSAILGAALAIVVLVSTLTFAASLHTLVSRPALYGWNWDYELSGGGGVGNVPEQLAAKALDHDHDVAGWSVAYFGGVQIDGLSVPAFGGSTHATVAPPLLSGRGLDGPGQVVLGATTLAQLHKRIGDTVSVNTGGKRLVALKVVGTSTMPAIGGSGSGSLHMEMGTGALFPFENIPPALRDLGGNTPPGPNAVFVRFRTDVNRTEALQKLNGIARELSLPTNWGVNVIAVQRPAEIVNYRSMSTTPLYLGLALAVGAVVALVLTLVTSVRRRRRDLALLKTLGFTRRQLAAVVAWQSTIAVAIGVIVGIPVGIILGRALWYEFAREIHAVPEPTVPSLTIALIALGALVLANVVAAIPGRQAARTQTAVLLRAE